MKEPERKKKQKSWNLFYILVAIYVVCFTIRGLISWIPALGMLISRPSNLIFSGSPSWVLYVMIVAELLIAVAALITVFRNSRAGIIIVVALLVIETIPSPLVNLNVNSLLIVVCIFGYLHMKRIKAEDGGAGRKRQVVQRAWKFNPYFLCAATLAAVILLENLFFFVVSSIGALGFQGDSSVNAYAVLDPVLQLGAVIFFYLAARKNRKKYALIGLILFLCDLAMLYVPELSYLFGSLSNVIWGFLLSGILAPPVAVTVIGLLGKERKTEVGLSA